MSETQDKPGLMSRPIPAPAVSIETKAFRGQRVEAVAAKLGN